MVKVITVQTQFRTIQQIGSQPAKLLTKDDNGSRKQLTEFSITKNSGMSNDETASHEFEQLSKPIRGASEVSCLRNCLFFCKLIVYLIEWLGELNDCRYTLDYD